MPTEQAHAATPEATSFRQVLRNAGITAAGNLLTQVLNPVTAIITTRALGAELYGLYALLVQWSSFLAELCKSGLGATLVRFVAYYRGEGRPDRLKGAIRMSLRWVGISAGIVSLVLVLWAGELSRWLPQTEYTESAVRFFAPAVFLTALYGIFLAVLTGFQQQRLVQLSTAVVGAGVKLLTLVLLLWMGQGIYAALGSSLLQDVAVLLLSGLFVARVFPGLRQRGLPAVVERKALWRYALTLFATSLFFRYTFQLDVLFLGFFRSAHEVGLYSAAVRLQPLLVLPVYALGEPFNPAVAELFARGEREALGELYRRVVRWSLLAVFPAALCCLTLPELILSLFGKEFTAAAPALQILALGTWLGAAPGVAGYVLNMIGRPQVNLFNGILTAVLNIALFAVLIPTAGMLGAAAAYSVVNLAIALLRVGQVYHLERLSPWDSLLGRALGCIAAGVGAAVAVELLLGSGVIAAAAGLAIFGVAGWHWALSDDERGLLRRLWRRVRQS
jgi:O-antigen/teichoic acid export membrane protein